jgi:cytoskeleton protein RodZ
VSEELQTPAAGAGPALHAERRRQNIGLGDVSRHLKLSIRQVEALERDEYASFAGPVFVHGFIRNYAKLLGVDPKPLIEAADVKLAPAADADREAAAMEVAEAPAPGQRTNIVLAVVAIMAVVAVAIYTTRSQEVPSQPGSRLEPLAAETPVQAAPVPETAQATEQVAATPAAPATPVVTDEGGSAVLRLVFEEESWVEVRDADGNALFAQLNPSGTRRSVSGDPPLTLVIGNAAGVRLWYQEREVDLAPYTRVDVARMTLE